MKPGMVRGETPRRGLKGPSSSSSVAKHPATSNPTAYYFEHGRQCVCVACRFPETPRKKR